MLTTVREGDRERLLREAARHLCQMIGAALAEGGSVNLALPGGRNVGRIFQAMRGARLDWQRVHVFVVDERLVPIDHPDSNYGLAREHLIEPLRQEGRLPLANAHPFLLDPATADRGLGGYERLLAAHGSRYDIILLSAGEDGHVGALYPHHHSIRDQHHGFLLMDDSPKPPAGRMTATLSLLRGARWAVLLFVGEAKRAAYETFLDPNRCLDDCPAKLVLSIAQTSVCTDLG